MVQGSHFVESYSDYLKILM
uniref:Uncharacterized protein n=1 Tax=Arundo donax TaxID=35708 RepID=A0A0A9C7U8_ARUDO